MKESNIQKKVEIYLSKYGIPIRINCGKFWQGKLEKDPYSNRMILTNLKAIKGAPEGCSDLFFFREGGKTYFIEMKSSKGTERKAQKRFREVMSRMGFTCIICRSIDDVIKMLKNS